MGMQFFAGSLKFDDEGFYDPVNGSSPRENFDTLHGSAMTVFLILIGDGWNTVMYDCMRVSGAVAAMYFISLVLFGNIIMLNLFLAVLLGNFDKARHFMIKKKVLEEFLKTKEKKISL